MLADLSQQQLAQAMRTRVDGAWNLHELTSDLKAFVMFSDTAGLLTARSRAANSAANAFVAALVEHRRTLGLPATSIVWGDVPIEPILTGQSVIAETIRPAAIRATGVIPPLLKDIVRPLAPAPVPVESLASRLTGLPDDERHRLVLDLIRGAVAAVLGHNATGTIGVDRSFQELGFDSMTAVELRNRLRDATGLTLPATLAFDHPSLAALTKYVLGQVADRPPVLAELEGLEAAIAAAAPGGINQAVTIRLRMILAKLTDDADPADPADPAADLMSASVDDIFALIDTELGRQAD
jgi:acyl carrier protein